MKKQISPNEAYKKLAIAAEHLITQLNFDGQIHDDNVTQAKLDLRTVLNSQNTKISHKQH